MKVHLLIELIYIYGEGRQYVNTQTRSFLIFIIAMKTTSWGYRWRVISDDVTGKARGRLLEPPYTDVGKSIIGRKMGLCKVLEARNGLM